MRLHHLLRTLVCLAPLTLAACGGGNEEAPAATPPASTAPVVTPPVVTPPVVPPEVTPPVVTPPVVSTTALPSLLMLRGPAQAALGNSVTFSSNTAALSGLTYLWEFSDGTTSTTPEVTRSFTTQGDRTVKLTVRNTRGDSLSATQPLWIGRFSNIGGVRCTGADRSGWCQPTGELRRKVYFIDDWRGFAIGDDTLVKRTSDGGVTWQNLPLLPGADTLDMFISISFADERNGWMLGIKAIPNSIFTDYRIVAYRTQDGGETWQSSVVYEQLAGNSPYFTVTALSAKRVLVNYDILTPYDASLRSTDGGVTWQALRGPAPQGGAVEISYSRGKFTRAHASETGVVWALSSTGAVIQWDLGDTGFKQVFAPTAPFASLSFLSDDKQGWALSLGPVPGSTAKAPTVWQTTDGGSQWSRISISGLPSQIDATSNTQLEFSDARNGWLFVTSTALQKALPAIYKTADGGRSWTASVLPRSIDSAAHPTISLLDVFPGGGARLSLSGLGSLGPDGTFLATVSFLTRDGGSWSAAQAEQRGAVATPSGSSILAQNGGGGWIRSDADGTNAATVLSGSPIFAAASGYASKGRITALGFIDVNRWLTQANYSPSGRVIFGSAKTTDGSETWQPFYGTVGQLTTDCSNGRYQFTSSTHGWFASSAAQIARTTDGGQTWSNFSLVTAFNAISSFNTSCAFDVDFVDDQHGWATWQIDTAPIKTPIDKPSVVRRTSDGGISWTDPIELPFLVTSMRFANASRGLVAGLGGRIALTRDGGTTWTIRTSGTTQDLIRVFWIDAQHALALGVNGAIQRSADGGETWTSASAALTLTFADPTQDISRGYGAAVAIAFADGNNGWVAGRGGRLLATTDGGATWGAQDLGGTSDPVAIQAISATQVKLIDRNGVVYLTETGGR